MFIPLSCFLEHLECAAGNLTPRAGELDPRSAPSRPCGIRAEKNWPFYAEYWLERERERNHPTSHSSDELSIHPTKEIGDKHITRVHRLPDLACAQNNIHPVLSNISHNDVRGLNLSAVCVEPLRPWVQLGLRSFEYRASFACFRRYARLPRRASVTRKSRRHARCTCLEDLVDEDLWFPLLL